LVLGFGQAVGADADGERVFGWKGTLGGANFIHKGKGRDGRDFGGVDLGDDGFHLRCAEITPE
jgi:hypothetical protein